MYKLQNLSLGGNSNIKFSPWKDKEEGDFKPLAKVYSEVSKFNSRNHIFLNRGEPLIHPKILKILDFLNKLHFKNIHIVTNGRILKYNQFCKRLNNYENLILYIQLLSTDKDTHDRISGIKGSFEQTIEGIKNIASMEMESNIIVPVTESSIREADKFMKLADKYNISNVIFYLAESLDNKFFFGGGYQKLRELVKNEYINIGLENIPLCLIPELQHYRQRNILKFKSDYAKDCRRCFSRFRCPGIIKAGKNNLKAKPIKSIKSKLDFVHFQINKRSVLNISPDEIMKILRLAETPIDLWSLIDKSGYPIPIVLIALEELEKAELISIEDKINTIVKLPNPQKILDMSSERLESDPRVCQLKVAQKDLLRRVEYIINTCSSGGMVAVVGDDDFMSVNLASTKMFDQVIVFEIDKRIVKKINEIALKYKLKLKALEHDLRNPLPKRYQGKFDIAYMDSPYSTSGFVLFVSRGIELLKKKPQKHIFASFSCEIPVVPVELEVQEAISRMGLYLERKKMQASNEIPQELIENFKGYKELKKKVFSTGLTEQEKWYFGALARKETLFHLLTTERTRPEVKGKYTKEIYYEDDPLRFYTDMEYIKEIQQLHDKDFI